MRCMLLVVLLIVAFTQLDLDECGLGGLKTGVSMLELAFGLTETSRLGCQIRVEYTLDGLTVKVPDDL